MTEATKTKPPRWMEYMKVSDLKRALVNPKGHSPAQLEKSLRRFGFLDAIVMDERTMRLVAGHGRVEKLLDLEGLGAPPPDWPKGKEWPPEGVMVTDGAWYVPVQRGWSSENDEEAMAAGITLNRQTELGGWDVGELAAELDRLAAGPGLEGVGFDHTDLQGMLDDMKATEVFPTGIPEATRIDLLPLAPRHHVLVTYLDDQADRVRAAVGGLEDAVGVEVRWSP